MINWIAQNQPISVTPSFANIFERVLLTQMTDFIDKHKIINKEQFGFLKKSTTDAVLQQVELVFSNLDQRIETVAIFLDLAKAFNSISQEAKELLCSFLANRRQKVKLNGIFSDCEIVKDF